MAEAPDRVPVQRVDCSETVYLDKNGKKIETKTRSAPVPPVSTPKTEAANGLKPALDKAATDRPDVEKEE